VKKTLQISLIFIFLLSGCSSLKQGWKNFTAYYNTFYNTQQFYDEGLRLNKRQAPPLNPMQPIRVHQSPTNAGLDQFQQAIERGSSILRNHDESKYVLPAIFIIGKSYYYRSEFFAALEKFQELQTLGTEEFQQKAILWQGLTYLEMDNYTEGIRFLDVEMDLVKEWDPELLAETHAVLAQLHTQARNWENVIANLRISISDLQNRDLLARAYFLLGQALEEVGGNNQALYAYSQIGDIRTTFELEYHALRKEAEISRRVQSFDRAENLYRQMRRDDKFIDYRNELQYEIARTLQIRGATNEAITTYNSVLRDQRQTPSTLTRAKTYFGLGEIYRDDVGDFSLAAAYFDSAAAQRVDGALLPDDFNARELAESFGQYAEIKQQISEKDSLLNLAALSPEELDEFVAELQRIEQQRLEEEMSRMQADRDQMIVVEETDSVVDAAESTEFGFLNINSQTMLADASLQFQAVWGDRPLADNWRRRADVSGSRFDQLVIIDESAQEIALEEETAGTGVQAAIDLSGIPFTEEEQQQVRAEITDLHYQLANVFFLSLDMPDSASIYYQKVADRSMDRHLRTMSLYSMAEIELLNNNAAAATNHFNQLREINPNSIYTTRLADRLDIEIFEEEEEAEMVLQQEYLNIISAPDTISSAERAGQLVRLAGNGINDTQRAQLLFEAAREYMTAAKKSSENHDEAVDHWFQVQQEFNDRQAELAMLKDSSQVMLQDTNLTETELEFWQQIADSTLTAPNFSEYFPFEGAYWDSTRSLLAAIEEQYASARIVPNVRTLRETLQKPEQPEPETELPEIPDGDSDGLDDLPQDIQSCEDAGLVIDFDGGLEAFMGMITFPSWTENITMRGELAYLLEVASDGSVINYEQQSRMDRSGIPQSVENAIDRLLTFEPTGSDETVQCTLTFPIDL
jgi:tetratricopeptide (TPR) repeat protein